MACPNPDCARRAEGDIMCAIHTSAMIVNQTSHVASMADRTSRGRIHTLPVALANRLIQAKPPLVGVGGAVRDARIACRRRVYDHVTQHLWSIPA